MKPMKLSLLPNAVYLFKHDNSADQNRLQTTVNQGPQLSLDKLPKLVGLKQFT